MSRLDSFIRRMQAQRACLDSAIRLMNGLPGNVLEFGLGNGRTYDHLRERLPMRNIYVFERQVAAHTTCIPPADKLFLGDVLETLPLAVARLGANTALANIDIGAGNDAATRDLVRRIMPTLLNALKPGAVIVSGQPIEHASLATLALPSEIMPDRYFIYARAGCAGMDPAITFNPANENLPAERRCRWVNDRS